MSVSTLGSQAHEEGSDFQYRHGLLDIEYRPDRGQLDLWFDRRVLSVVRSHHKVQVLRYTPGHWELDLIRAAKVVA